MKNADIPIRHTRAGAPRSPVPQQLLTPYMSLQAYYWLVQESTNAPAPELCSWRGEPPLSKKLPWPAQEPTGARFSVTIDRRTASEHMNIERAPNDGIDEDGEYSD